jgi:hypothetical protein
MAFPGQIAGRVPGWPRGSLARAASQSSRAASSGPPWVINASLQLSSKHRRNLVPASETTAAASRSAGSSLAASTEITHSAMQPGDRPRSPAARGCNMPPAQLLKAKEPPPPSSNGSGGRTVYYARHQSRKRQRGNHPPAMPIAAGCIPCRKTNPTNSPRGAPKAARIPGSRTRRVTDRSLSPSGTMDVMAADLSPGYGGHTLERWLYTDGETGAQSRCLGAQGKHLRLARYELGRTEGLKAVPHTKDGFDVRAAVVA